LAEPHAVRDLDHRVGLGVGPRREKRQPRQSRETNRQKYAQVSHDAPVYPPAMVKSMVSGASLQENRMGAKPRRITPVVDIAGVKVGGSHPIVVQSMTNTDTEDVASTVNQVMALARAGSELVRVTVNTEKAAAAVPRIVYTVRDFGVRVPIIGDFHYNGHILLKKYPDCARALSKYRINPGNVNIGKKHDDNFRTMIEAAV